MISVVVAAALAAHIQLDAPLVRYPNTPREVNKSCPCGAGAGDDHCSNGVTTDDNRDPSRVTTFVAGETITVRWRETIGHRGRYRIAFSPDGADLDAFDAHVLKDDVVDPAGEAGNTGDADVWEVQVTLPDTPCDNCVLQLVQDMGGDTNNPVGDLPNGHDLYFQCADIVLLAAGEGEGEGEGTVGGEGEGEGTAGGEGEGEGSVGGEGEGEGERAEGEGEGEGEGVDDGCAAASLPLPVVGLLLLRRRRRRR